MTTTSIPLDLGLLAFLDTLNRQPDGKVANSDEALLAALKKEGHVFSAHELTVIKTFAIDCVYVETRENVLLLTRYGRQRLETAIKRPTPKPATNAFEN